MCYIVGYLEQPIIRCFSKVWYIGEIVQRSPTSSQLPEILYPAPCSIMIGTLGKDQKATLIIIPFIAPPC